MKLMNYTILEAIKKAKMFSSTIDGGIIIPLSLFEDKKNIIIGDNPDFYDTLCLSIKKPNDEFFIIECYELLWGCEDDKPEDDDRLAKMIVFDEHTTEEGINLTIETREKDLELAKSLINKEYDVVYSKSVYFKLNYMFNKIYRPDGFSNEELYTLD